MEKQECKEFTKTFYSKLESLDKESCNILEKMGDHRLTDINKKNKKNNHEPPFSQDDAMML